MHLTTLICRGVVPSQLNHGTQAVAHPHHLPHHGPHVRLHLLVLLHQMGQEHHVTLLLSPSRPWGQGCHTVGSIINKPSVTVDCKFVLLHQIDEPVVPIEQHKLCHCSCEIWSDSFFWFNFSTAMGLEICSSLLGQTRSIILLLVWLFILIFSLHKHCLSAGDKYDVWVLILLILKLIMMVMMAMMKIHDVAEG